MTCPWKFTGETIVGTEIQDLMESVGKVVALMRRLEELSEDKLDAIGSAAGTLREELRVWREATKSN